MLATPRVGSMLPADPPHEFSFRSFPADADIRFLPGPGRAAGGGRKRRDDIGVSQRKRRRVTTRQRVHQFWQLAARSNRSRGSRGLGRGGGARRRVGAARGVDQKPLSLRVADAGCGWQRRSRRCCRACAAARAGRLRIKYRVVLWA